MRHIIQRLTATFFVSASLAATAQADTVRQYQWLTGTEQTGHLIVTEKDDGSVSTQFQFNDRGRGPEAVTHIRINQNAIVTSFKASGLNYRKGTIDEHFSISDNHASWQVDGMQTTADLNNPAIYLPSNPTPEYRAVFARALLAQPDYALPMITGDLARLTVLESISLEKDSKKVTVTLHEIEGPEIGPQYVWLDDDKNLFGYSLGWFEIIRDGWAHAAPTLKEKQNTANEQYLVRKSAEYAHKPAGDIVISGARILNTKTGTLSAPKKVRLSEGHIAEIAPTDAPLAGYEIDGSGKVLMPALWDMHGHVGLSSFLNYIAGGFLNVRDMANDPNFINKARKSIAAAKIAAPDIHPMGFIDQAGPYAAPTGNLAHSLEEALEQIDAYHAMGYKGVKLYSSIEPDWIPAMAARAHSYGMKVMGHIPSYMTAGEAIKAGYDEITHINMALLHLIGDKSIDTRTPKRFIVPGEQAGKLDLSNQRTADFIKLMKNRNIPLDPTLGIFLEMFLGKPGQPRLMAAPFVEQLPHSLRPSTIAAKGYNDGQEDIFAKSAQVTKQLLKKLHEEGITILPGTDTYFPGFALISELEMYVNAGIPVPDVIKLATISAANHIGLGYELGTVSTGKKAHLILVDGDPTQDISNLRKLSHVIKGQVYYRPAEILHDQGYKTFAEIAAK